MTGEREGALHALEQRLGYRFADLALLDRALTHASLANETAARHHGDNEALEFLGDAVLGMVVTDLLHRRDPDGAEGAKSRRRARLVSEPSLARRAADLGLPDLLLLGRGEEKTGGREKAALWANAYEALVAALYLDGGFEAAHRFVRADFARDFEIPDEELEDPKSRLQELLQGEGRPVPRYGVVEEVGPSHRRRFRVECRLDDGTVTSGEGYSKKEAQQQAAREALAVLRGAASEPE
ncbi:MAG TPA: ribonuclease III [Vicinamibacteria bacterium]|nr:ribonuclease III [Vicinamibacteria bacterium]